MARRSKVYQLSDEEFRKIVSESNSYSDCLRVLGLTTRGGSSTDVLKERINELGCDTSHFGKFVTVSPNVRYELDDILIKDSTYKNISCLKNRLIKEGKLEYKCERCGLSSWLGESISLQLDHINGDNTDHRLENLRFLCPNCHSLTSTYSGKNKGKKNTSEES